MKKIILYTSFICLTGFTTTISLPVIAGGCSSHIDKKAAIECAEDDTKCQSNKSEEYDLDKTVRS